MPKRKKGEGRNEYVSRAVSHLMKKEGKTQKQALGQAYGMARSSGLSIPKKKPKK